MTARQEPDLAARLRGGEVRSVDELPAGEVRRGLGAFLDEFGDRAVREAELATPRWNEEPAPVFAMLAAALEDPHGDPAGALARARERADRALSELQVRLSPLELAAVRALVAHTRRTTALRERMRGWVTRALSAIRWAACEADRRLRAVDPSLEPGAAFFCTVPELCEALASERLDLGPVVALRRAEHARDEQRPDPPVTFMGRPPPVVLPPAGKHTLVGLAASAGVVEGPVRVMVNGQLPHRLRPGEILVARTTDVGLTPLFLVAAGVVTELGGPLSHAALVAREYGVPAVVNVAGVVAALRQGELVRVDGNRGRVERLAPP
jgi:pyruvate,water dikinase